MSRQLALDLSSGKEEQEVEEEQGVSAMIWRLAFFRSLENVAAWPPLWQLSWHEAAQEEGSPSKPFDENGNPVQPISRSQYLRMRQSPSTQHKAPTDPSSSALLNNDPTSLKGDRHGMGTKSEDPLNSSGLSSSDKRKRRKNGLQASPAVEAQNYPDYVGDCDVDSLVKFINNDIGKKKLKKGGNPDGSVSQKTDKSKPRSKQLLTTGVGENPDDGLTPASETTQLLRSTASFTTYSSVGDHSVLTAYSKPLSGVQTGTEETENPEVTRKIHVDMGNTVTSKTSLDSAEIVDQVGAQMVKNHVSVTAPTEPSTQEKVSPEEDQANRRLSWAKLDSVSKKGWLGEGKDKVVKSKNGGTNNHKKDSAQHTDNNQANKKVKGKPTKTVIKTESATEKISMPLAQEKKSSSCEETGLPCDLEKSVALDIIPDSVIYDAIYNDSVFSNGPVINVAQDEEFTVVSTKRKKRAVQGRTPNTPATTSSHPYSSKDSDLSHPSSPFSPDSFSYNRRGHWESQSHWETYGRRSNPQPQHRTSSPPPQQPSPPSSLPEKESQGAEREEESSLQDLSQSAFPALNPSERGCGLFQFVGQEARSLEDLPCGAGQLSFDMDSDQASSKSLPAVQARGVKGRVNYPVSYASMASANTPRQSVDSSQAASLSSGIGGEGQCEEEAPLTPTTAIKWKGSPQERRHSIGSAPEDLCKAVGGSNSLQRTGSQEMLPRDTKDSPSPEKGGKNVDSSEKDGKSVDNPKNSGESLVSHTTCVTPGNYTERPEVCAVAQNDSSVDCGPTYPPSSDADAAHSKETVPTAQVPTQKLLSGSASRSIPTMLATSSTSSQALLLTGALPAHSSSHLSSSDSSRMKETQSSSSSRSQSVPGTSQSRAKLVKPVNNGNKKKIVIFCDDSEEETRDCDYSFGDLPVYWTHGGSLVMPSGCESAAGTAGGAKKEAAATVELVSPASCSAADNPCSVSLPTSLRTNLEMPCSSSLGREVRQSTAGSSQSETGPTIKPLSNSTRLKNHCPASGSSSVCSDSQTRSSDLLGQCEVDMHGPSRPSTTSVAPCDATPSSANSSSRSEGKRSKGVHTGLNGVIPVQGLMGSPTTMPATVSASSSSPDYSSSSPSLSIPAGCPVAAPCAEESGAGEASSLAAPSPQQWLWPVPPYCPLHEPLEQSRHQEKVSIQASLNNGWNAFVNDITKNPQKYSVYNLESGLVMKYA